MFGPRATAYLQGALSSEAFPRPEGEMWFSSCPACSVKLPCMFVFTIEEKRSEKPSAYLLNARCCLISLASGSWMKSQICGGIQWKSHSYEVDMTWICISQVPICTASGKKLLAPQTKLNYTWSCSLWQTSFWGGCVASTVCPQWLLRAGAISPCGQRVSH